MFENLIPSRLPRRMAWMAGSVVSVFKLEEKMVGGAAQSDENCRRKAGNCHGNGIGVYHKAKLEENL